MGGGGACVSCRGRLKVETVSTEDPSQPLYNVVITANGPGGFSRTRTSRRRRGRAIASFGRVRPGDYTIVIGGGNAAEGNVQARQTTELTVRLAVPSITVAAPKVVLVKKQYQDGTDGLNPHRIRVQLGASSNFGGTGRFTCNHTNHIRLYDAETGGNQINLPYDIPGGELAAGKTVYVEGAQPSVRRNNTRLTLTLQGGSPAGWGTAREDITCVELKLEICKWRTSRRAYPRPFSENEKHNPGRYVCLYDGQGSTERAMMILHKARPHNYNGTLSLIPLDNRVQVFESEQGGAAQPNYRIANRRVSPSGKRLWVQGANVSGGLRDTGCRVELQNPANKEGDRVRITVVRLRMDVFKARTAPTAAPVAFPNNDKVTTGRFVHVQNPGNQHERAKVVVQRVQPNAFNGRLVLAIGEQRTGNPINRAQLFDNEDAANPAGQVAHPNPYGFNHDAAFPAAGREFWVEGRGRSRRVRDTQVCLGIEDHIRCGDRVLLTVIQAILDVYQSRRRAGREPGAMSSNDKVNVGRYLHVQDAGNNHGRALVLARRVRPNDFDGTLSLTVCDANGNASNRAQLFDHENPATPAGQAAHPNPYEIPHNAAFPRRGRRLWAQGSNVSAALRDTEVWLGVRDHIRRCDRFTATIVQFTQIQATIDSTPPNTPVNRTAMNAGNNIHPNIPLPADYVFQRNLHSEDFTANTPLVLMRNAQPDIQLEVTVDPAAPVDLPISWDAVRNPDDHASLGRRNAKPTVTRDPANRRRATLNTNQRGSFRVRPYIDCNGRNEYSPGEPSIPLNLVLADATVRTNNTRGNQGSLSATLNVAAQRVRIRNGVWPAGAGLTNADLAAAGMQMEINARVTGGGANGRLGIDRVFAGLVNNLRTVNIQGAYRDTTPPNAIHNWINVYVSNSSDATTHPTAAAPNNATIFEPGDLAPATLVWPILDSGRRPGGVGGETATMTRSRFTRSNIAVGQRFRIRCIDSPGRSFSLRHPLATDFPNARLQSILYRHQFSAYFCFWTNLSMNIGATGDPADRLYSLIYEVDWEMTGDWTINYPAAGPPVLNTVNAHRVRPSVPNGTRVRPIGRAEDHNVEVRPPSGITGAIGWDGRN